MIAEGRVLKVKVLLDIYYAKNAIRKVQHNKPSKEKVFNYLKKFDKDCSFEDFNEYIDKRH